MYIWSEKRQCLTDKKDKNHSVIKLPHKCDREVLPYYCLSLQLWHSDRKLIENNYFNQLVNSIIPCEETLGIVFAIKTVKMGWEENPVPGPSINTLKIKSLGFSLTEQLQIVLKSPPCVLRAVLNFQENTWITIME